MVDNERKFPVNKSLKDIINRNLKRKEKISRGNIPAKTVVVNKTIMPRKLLESSNNIQSGVSIIVSTNRENSLENILSNYIRQDYKKKELIIIINKDSIDLDQWKEKVKENKDIQIFKIDETVSLGKCLNFGVMKSKYNYIAKFDDDDYYGPKYLVDSLKNFAKTDAGLVGKQAIYVYFKRYNELTIMSGNMENQYVDFISGSTMVFKKEIFSKVCFQDISIAEDSEFCSSCIRNGIKLYSGNRYHYLYIRESSEKAHTWQMKNKDIKKTYCKTIGNFYDMKKVINYVNI